MVFLLDKGVRNTLSTLNNNYVPFQLMIDCLLLKVLQQIFHACLGREQVQQNLKAIQK